jgi:Tfp pilus assembly protein PilF
MSLILDALRRGRPPEITQPNSSTAQTDAVLQTLGYGHLEPSSSSKRIRRLIGYAFLALLAVVAICGAVIWFARQHYATDEGVHIVHRAPAAAAESAAVETPQMQTPATGLSSPAGPAGPAGMSAGFGASATLPIVQDSRQPDVPVALPAPPAGAASSRTPAPDADHFQLALYYQRSGDFENALLQYRAVLQRDELNAEAHNNLGLLYRGKGLYDEAAKEFVRAIAINQRYVKAHNNLGVTYLRQQKADAAAAEFQTALGIDPRNVESLVNLSITQKDAAAGDLGRGSLARALEIDPHSAEAHYNLALMADEAGDKALALTHYRAFLQYGNDHPELAPQVRARIDVLSR